MLSCHLTKSVLCVVAYDPLPRSTWRPVRSAEYPVHLAPLETKDYECPDLRIGPDVEPRETSAYAWFWTEIKCDMKLAAARLIHWLFFSTRKCVLQGQEATM